MAPAHAHVFSAAACLRRAHGRRLQLRRVQAPASALRRPWACVHCPAVARTTDLLCAHIEGPSLFLLKTNSLQLSLLTAHILRATQVEAIICFMHFNKSCQLSWFTQQIGVV